MLTGHIITTEKLLPKTPVSIPIKINTISTETPEFESYIAQNAVPLNVASIKKITAEKFIDRSWDQKKKSITKPPKNGQEVAENITGGISEIIQIGDRVDELEEGTISPTLVVDDMQIDTPTIPRKSTHSKQTIDSENLKKLFSKYGSKEEVSQAVNLIKCLEKDYFTGETTKTKESNQSETELGDSGNELR
ncbi:MAG: hypothetical protein IKL55_04110 [Clostridia bacterium]|nr:hypothetical protein [Clostridia bacterium]